MKIKTKKCKQCKEPFVVNPIFPLQYVCNYKCAIARNKEAKDKKERKDWKVKKSVMKIDTHAKEYKREFQNNINLLARMIDLHFGYETCIDCTKGYGKQTDGAHFTSVGSNCSLRYNLHNIHSANSQCNQYSDTHKEGYKLGLEKRYGKEYAEMVIDGLKIKYPEIKLTANDVHEKLTLVRSVIRNFKTFQLDNSIQARNLFNKLISIYP